MHAIIAGDTSIAVHAHSLFNSAAQCMCVACHRHFAFISGLQPGTLALGANPLGSGVTQTDVTRDVDVGLTLGR